VPDRFDSVAHAAPTGIASDQGQAANAIYWRLLLRASPIGIHIELLANPMASVNRYERIGFPFSLPQSYVL
jgi:hypothetical protein